MVHYIIITFIDTSSIGPVSNGTNDTSLRKFGRDHTDWPTSLSLFEEVEIDSLCGIWTLGLIITFHTIATRGLRFVLATEMNK